MIYAASADLLIQSHDMHNNINLAISWRRPMMSAVLIVVVALALDTWGVQSWSRTWLHYLDRRWFDERIMDSLTRFKSAEDWNLAESLRTSLDDRWRRHADGKIIRIAHALGESGSASANTMAAMQRAHAAGFRLLEVDLWQQGDVLRCHHGPHPPPAESQDSCRFDQLLAALPPDSWLVLDLKTDFSSAGIAVLDLAKRSRQTDQLIFQIYEPYQLAIFNRWQAEYPLPAPILSIYRAHRSVNHIASAALRLRAISLAVPIERLEALSQRPEGLELLIHPVHDCATLDKALVAGAQGVYTLTDLHCPNPVAHGK